MEAAPVPLAFGSRRRVTLSPNKSLLPALVDAFAVVTLNGKLLFKALLTPNVFSTKPVNDKS